MAAGNQRHATPMIQSVFFFDRVKRISFRINFAVVYQLPAIEFARIRCEDSRGIHGIASVNARIVAFQRKRLHCVLRRGNSPLRAVRMSPRYRVAINRALADPIEHFFHPRASEARIHRDGKESARIAGKIYASTPFPAGNVAIGGSGNEGAMATSASQAEEMRPRLPSIGETC